MHVHPCTQMQNRHMCSLAHTGTWSSTHVLTTHPQPRIPIRRQIKPTLLQCSQNGMRYKHTSQAIVCHEPFVIRHKSFNSMEAGMHALACSPTPFPALSQFKTLDYQKLFDSMSKPAFIFDGRNILDHAALRLIGFEVYAIGKPVPAELL